MTASSSALCKASKIVSTYIKRSPYYVGRCSADLDHESIGPDIIIPAAESEVNKFKELIDDAQEESKKLMQYMIDISQNSFYVKNIHRSKNWVHAYELLDEFNKNILSKDKIIANKHSDRIQEYKSSPDYYVTLYPKITGDVYINIEKAFDNMNKKLNHMQKNLSDKDYNYLILLLIYSVVYALKKLHRVNMYPMAWNSFKRSLESYFLELTNTVIPESSVIKSQDGYALAHYNASYWDDMDYFEKKVDAVKPMNTELKVNAILEASQKYIQDLTDSEKDDLKDNITWCFKYSRNDIMPQIIHRFSEPE